MVSNAEFKVYDRVKFTINVTVYSATTVYSE